MDTRQLRRQMMADHFPTPWRVCPDALHIYADNVPKGPARIADLRGWGYLTGKGHGALGLTHDEGTAVQKANADFIVKAVNSHDHLIKALEASCGYLLNAKIDLETGCTKATAIRTIEGGLLRAKAVLAIVATLTPADRG